MKKLFIDKLCTNNMYLNESLIKKKKLNHTGLI